ncbi:uncharacterized protein KY384_003268 [Bacidia gigantensis]|uniref:uncharacterized protein n=1 Tax=Bacidia gigantensis TaxID=2732470 RepID=UPI001D03CF91|nr:uncharacterized protein KY384_003268 [Bacidia gigantensis]KAG8531637.1 hypothetical protein KY384_003268 [Bacidia gigantensis]
MSGTATRIRETAKAGDESQSHATYSNDDSKLGCALEDAFGALHVEETASPYEDIARVNQDLQDGLSELYYTYKDRPANSFHRPIVYRVSHSRSATQQADNIRARLFPAPAFEALGTSQLTVYLRRHQNFSNRKPTPFISLTPDLIRALHLMFYTYKDETNLKISHICPWKLTPGSYIPLNDLRTMCGLLTKDIYNTETLVWGEIPASSIICQWQREQIVTSGLVDIFPALTNLSPKARLQDLRDSLRCVTPPFFARKVAQALVKLGMEASRFQIKQVFLFLLGQAAGYRVEKELGNVEAQLESRFPEVVDKFERAAYELSMAIGKSQKLSYYQQSYAAEMQKMCPPKDPLGLLSSVKYRPKIILRHQTGQETSVILQDTSRMEQGKGQLEATPTSSSLFERLSLNHRESFYPHKGKRIYDKLVSDATLRNADSPY